MNRFLDSANPKVVIGAAIAVAALTAFTLLGQYAGGLLFALLDQLPHSAVGVTTLYRYWPAYGDVPHVHKSLVVATIVAVMVAVLPFCGVIAMITHAVFKKRDLHGSARFATPREIRKAGLVEKN